MCKMPGLMPLLPSLVVFGFGILLLHFGKKEKSKWLKLGGYVLSIMSIAVMLVSVYMLTTNKHCKGPRYHCNGPSCRMEPFKERAQ